MMSILYFTALFEYQYPKYVFTPKNKSLGIILQWEHLYHIDKRDHKIASNV